GGRGGWQLVAQVERRRWQVAVTDEREAACTDERRVVGHHVAHTGLLVRIAVKHSITAADREVSRMRGAPGETDAGREVVQIRVHETSGLTVQTGVYELAVIGIPGSGDEVGEMVVGF